ncbi:calcium-binding protein [Serratia marcescens]|uniref:calcium-binding protein n=1 Tax=Serratia marcescens TaxID=615 RepID=UPI003AAA738D
MLQIGSGKLFTRDVEYHNKLKGVIYSNLHLMAEDRIETDTGSIEGTSTFHNSNVLIFTYTELIEALPDSDGPGFMASHGIASFISDFSAILSFALNCIASPSYSLIERLLSDEMGTSTHTVPNKVVNQTFDKVIYCQESHKQHTINGGGGEDVLHGEDGNDVLSGGHSEDRLFGGAGNDALSGNYGADRLFGEAGFTVTRHFDLKRPLKHEIEVIRRSELFKAPWYQKRYPDVGMSGLDPETHYLLIGGILLRDPSPDFSTAFYLNDNPDVARAGMNPLLHFIRFGATEGRRCQPAVEEQRNQAVVHTVGPEPWLATLRQGAFLDNGSP